MKSNFFLKIIVVIILMSLIGTILVCYNNIKEVEQRVLERKISLLFHRDSILQAENRLSKRKIDSMYSIIKTKDKLIGRLKIKDSIRYKEYQEALNTIQSFTSSELEILMNEEYEKTIIADTISSN